MKPLLKAFQVGDLTLKNRFVLAAMTRLRALENGCANDLMSEYYGQRSSAGLLTTECAYVSKSGRGYQFAPGIVDSAQINAWRKVTDRVHLNQTPIFLQLWHAGRAAHSSLLPDNLAPYGPSSIKAPGETFTPNGMAPYELPQEMSKVDIHNAVYDFGKAALNSVDAGFDGVEIHAGFGYLIDQFLQDSANQRKDEYGGSTQNRCRFLLEIIEEIASYVSLERVGLKITPTNRFLGMKDSNSKELFSSLAKTVSNLNLAYLHISAPDLNAPAEDSILDARFFREFYRGTLIANNNYTFSRAEAELTAKSVDLISFGKLFVANPDLPDRYARESSLNVLRKEFLYQGGETGYTDYETLDPLRMSSRE